MLVALTTIAGVLDGVQGRAATAPGTPTEVGFTLTNQLPFERKAEPVTCGLPLARGFVRHADELTLLDANGRALPVQVLTTSTYNDGTPRWVLLGLHADLPPEGEAVYRLAHGARASVRDRLDFALAGGVATIDTGSAQFRIDTNCFRLFDSVQVGGRELLAQAADGGTRLEQEGGSQHVGHEKTTQAEFEDAGPLAVVLCVRGEFRPGAGLPLADYVCRMQFFAGKGEVRVCYTLHNPATHHHPGNVWDLGAGGSVFMEDFSIVLPLAQGDWASRVGVGADRPALAASKLYQDSSGGQHWDSPNHIDKDLKLPTRFRGYRVYEAETQLADGNRADGWIHVRGASGGVAAGVRDFWQNFPKALEFNLGRLRVGLWPSEFAGVHEMLGGEQKTHEMLLVFHDARCDGSGGRAANGRLSPPPLRDARSAGGLRHAAPSGPRAAGPGAFRQSRADLRPLRRSRGREVRA